jgi:hypothetical protein
MRCNLWIWWFGTPVLEIYNQEPGEVELFVRSVEGVSGQRVDWHSGGGHAIIRACGNLRKVARAIDQLKPRFKFSCSPC